MGPLIGVIRTFIRKHPVLFGLFVGLFSDGVLSSIAIILAGYAIDRELQKQERAAEELGKNATASLAESAKSEPHTR